MRVQAMFGISKKEKRLPQDIMYNLGVKKIEKQLDIVRHLKKLRVADSVAHLTLSEFQRKLIPFFDRNILQADANQESTASCKMGNRFVLKKTLIKQEGNDLRRQLTQLISNSRRSILDAKLISSIGVLNPSIQSDLHKPDSSDILSVTIENQSTLQKGDEGRPKAKKKIKSQDLDSLKIIVNPKKKKITFEIFLIKFKKSRGEVKRIISENPVIQNLNIGKVKEIK